jgi:hypothetical protein
MCIVGRSHPEPTHRIAADGDDLGWLRLDHDAFRVHRSDTEDDAAPE